MKTSSPRIISRSFDRLLRTFVIPLAAAFLTAPAHGSISLTWKCSTNSAPWVDKPDVAMSDNVPLPTSTSTSRIFVDSTHTFQAIDGWGGCFNERGWKAMEVLTPANRDAVMKALFDPQTGLKLTYGRTPIGASDYAITLYSLDETAGDYAMADFSIARDQERLIPYIKAALAIQPNLYLWAVPWSPPSWMKKNSSLAGKTALPNEIIDDDQTLDALALYFVRYLQAYQGEGIKISMVMPQNEPNIDSNYTSCLWTGVQLSNFVGHHLGPAFTNAGLSTEIFLGTLNDSSRGGYSYWVAPSMQDAQTRGYVSGVGCQWSADVTMNETRIVLPEMKLMQTEAECGSTNSNDWAFAEYQYQLAKKWFGAGASSNILWNLVLDQTGLSTGGWAQCSPIVVNSSTQAVTYTPFYYLYKHFSYFVQPGAHLATTYSTWGDKIAFANPDGSAVAVIGNSASSSYDVTLNFNGKQSATVTLPAHSFNTFVLPAPLSAVEEWRLQYFGTTVNSGDAADAADPDGDSMTNSQEFISGTIPTDGNSYLKVQVQTDGGGVLIAFSTVVGRVYRIEVSDTLRADSWSVLQGGIAGTGGIVQVVDGDAGAHPSRFYRAVVTNVS
jgi:glucosylceramidase